MGVFPPHNLFGHSIATSARTSCPRTFCSVQFNVLFCSVCSPLQHHVAHHTCYTGSRRRVWKRTGGPCAQRLVSSHVFLLPGPNPPLIASTSLQSVTVSFVSRNVRVEFTTCTCDNDGTMNHCTHDTALHCMQMWPKRESSCCSMETYYQDA